MQQFWILILILTSVVAERIDFRKLFDEAEGEVQEELKAKMILGATSQRFHFRKENSITKKMVHRNNLFKKMSQKLERNGYNKEISRQLANEALKIQKRSTSDKTGKPVGQGGQTSNITIIQDSCDATVAPDCSFAGKYRTINGQCNNLNGHGYQGSAGTAFTRYKVTKKASKDIEDPLQLMSFSTEKIPGRTIPSTCGDVDEPEIEGKIEEPKSCGTNVDGCQMRTNLPGARLVSTTIHDNTDSPSSTATVFFSQFGQLLDHDITLTPEEHVNKCCDKQANGEYEPECSTIDVSYDEHYKDLGVKCLDFTRSVEHCVGNDNLVRQQTNGITSYVDGSHIYGSDDELALNIRTLANGELKTSKSANGDLLPKINDKFEAGDVRAREMPGLTVGHTIWIREHNRIAKLVAEHVTEDEEIYQLTRRIVVAEWQNIVYGQYMTELLDNQDLKPSVSGTRYDSSVDPAMTNEFATAAFRFGHSMIQSTIKMLATNDYKKEIGKYQLRHNFFDDTFYESNMENIIMGMIHNPAQSIGPSLIEDVTNHMFENVPAFKGIGTDLAARNIHRGRDHGIPGFCCYYKTFQDESFDCSKGWEMKYKGIPDDVWNKLQLIYECPSDIDLFTAGIAQLPEENGQLGKVFQKMIQDQFERTMQGDRFFYSHVKELGDDLKGIGFTKAARQIISARTMSGVICDTTGIAKVPQNVFSVNSEVIDCESTSKINSKHILELMKFI